jgi:hypothetical protein
MKKLIMVVMITMLSCGASYAQFGGLVKKIKNRVKEKAEKVEKKVTSTVTDKVTDVTTSVTDKVTNAENDVTDKVTGKISDVGNDVSDAVDEEGKSTKGTKGSKKTKSKKHQTYVDWQNDLQAKQYYEGSTYVKNGLWEKTFEPSAEAKQNDPLAGSTVTEKGYTRTVGQIHAAYEQLDPAVYHAPYWANRDFYFVDDKSKKDFGHLQALVMDELNAPQPCLAIPRLDCSVEVTTSDGKKGAVPASEFIIHRSFAEFSANPNACVPYSHFVEARSILNPSLKGDFEVPFANLDVPPNYRPDYKNVRTDKGDKPLLEETTARRHRWEKEERALEQMMYRACDYNEVIRRITVMWHNNILSCVKEKQYRLALKMTREYDIMMSDYRNHPDFKDGPEYQQLKKNQDLWDKLYPTWESTTQEPEAMPKTYAMGAALKKAALAEAQKEFPDFNIVDVVFLTNKWAGYNKPEWPYKHSHDSMRVGFISKEDGQYFIRQYDLQKYPSGTLYYVATMDLTYVKKPLQGYK